MEKGCSAPSAYKDKNLQDFASSLLHYSVEKRKNRADGKFEAVSVFAAMKPEVGHTLLWRVCVWSKWFLLLPPHLTESQACYQVFPCKGGWWEANGDNLFFSPPCGKKKIKKICSLLSSLTNSVTNWPTPWCGSNFLTEIISHVPAATAPNYTHAAWLKMLHTWPKVCPFLKIPPS